MSSFNKEQEQAIMTRGKTILVSAPAGSGKTRILVERMRRLIEEDRYEIDNFLVLTFTDAAGKEMKQRLSLQLHEDLANFSIDQETKAHIERQLLKLPQSYMTTFDSFCKALLEKYGYLVGVMPGFEVNASPELIQSTVLDQCFDKWIVNPKFRDYIRRHNLKNNFDDLKKTLINYNASTGSYVNFQETLQEFYNTYYHIDDFSSSPIFDLLVRSYKDAFEDALSNYNTLENYCSKENFECFFTGNEKKVSIAESLSTYLMSHVDAFKHRLTYDTFLSLLKDKPAPSANMAWKDMGLESGDEKRKRYDDLKKRVMAPINDLKDIIWIKDLNEFEELLNLSFQDIQFLLGKGGLLESFQSAYLEEKKRLNQLDFHDLEEYATKLLSDDLPVLKTINASLKEIMLDEYQDTNQIQENLVLKLAGQAHDCQGLQVVPMFMVGDMKQSIYRFRQADPRIFKEKFDTYVPYENATEQDKFIRIDLKHNYRSEKAVLDSINYIFDCIMDNEIGGLEYFNDPNALLRYDYVVKKKSLEELSQIHDYDSEVMIGFSEKTKEYTKSELEAHMIASKIIKMHEEEGYEFKDFAILMRNTTDFITYKKIFENYGIPANITLSKGLFDSNEAISLIALMKALINPNDDIAMASVLHNNFVFSHFDENELLAMRDQSEQPESLYEDVKKAGTYKSECFIDTFENLRKIALTSSPYDTLIAALEASRYQDFVSSLINGEQRSSNIDTLVELARSSDEYRYLEDFVDFVDSGVQKSPGKIASDESNAVEFMTIHKSKGLQFKVVFLSNMQHKFNTADETSYILMDQANGIASKYRQFRETDEFGNVLVEYENPYRNLIGKAIHKEAIDEEMRILYVALTRAEKKLVMTAVIDDETRLIDLAAKVQANESDPNRASNNTVIFNNHLRKVNCFFDWIMMALMRHPDIENDLKSYIPAITPNLDLRRTGFKKLNNEETALARFHLEIKSLTEITSTISQKQTLDAIDQYHQVQDYYNYVYPYQDKERSIAVTKLQALADEAGFEHLESQSSRREDALSLGTLVHNVLYYCPFDETDFTTLIARLKDEGMFTDDEYQLIHQYQHHLDDFRESDVYKIIAKSTFYKEKPFRYFNGEQVINGIFDIVFIHEGDVYVLDYKTDHITSSNSYKKLQDKHRIQLETYKEILTKQFHKPVKGYVYYLETNQMIEVQGKLLLISLTFCRIKETRQLGKGRGQNMRFVEYGNPKLPTIMLVHDIGLSYWAYADIKEELAKEYHVVLPILDGIDEEFQSIEDEANKIMMFIHNKCDGHVYALGGLAFGAKIVLEVLSKNSNIASYAIIESVDLYPTKGLSSLAPKVALSISNLTKYRWFTSRQAAATGLPKELNTRYHETLKSISSISFEHYIEEEYKFTLPPTLKNTSARTLIIFGEKEPHNTRLSARLINETIPYSQMYQILGMTHGQFSLQHPHHYVRLLKRLFRN